MLRTGQTVIPCAAVLLLDAIGAGVSAWAFADDYGRLPHGEGFRNVRDFGAKGDGVCDDASAFIRALELGRGGKGTREKAPANVYVPSGTHLVSDTLIVYRATMSAGDADNPTTLVLKKDSPGFSDPAKPKPMIVTYGAYESEKAIIDVPADPAATVTLYHLFFQMETPGGIWMDWRAGEKSMLIDTLCIPTSTKQELLWRISGNGGGFFENSWNPGVGLDGIEISSTGRKWMYGVQQEHYTRTAAILRGCENLAVLVFQFEGSSAPYVRMEDCRNVSIFQGIAGHWSGEPGPLFDVVGGRDLALVNSAICNNRSVITERPNGWKAGPSHPGSREIAGQTVWIKR